MSDAGDRKERPKFGIQGATGNGTVDARTRRKCWRNRHTPSQNGTRCFVSRGKQNEL